MCIFISPSGVTGGSCKIGGCPFGHPSLPSLLSQIFGKKNFSMDWEKGLKLAQKRVF